MVKVKHKKKKIGGKNISLSFIPYTEIDGLESSDRIKKLLDIVVENRILVLQGRLTPEEESRLIENTMVLVKHLRSFKGVELAVVNPNANKISFGKKIRSGLARALIGERDVLTIIGPASIVKSIKKDPKKIELMFK